MPFCKLQYVQAEIVVMSQVYDAKQQFLLLYPDQVKRTTYLVSYHYQRYVKPYSDACHIYLRNSNKYKRHTLCLSVFLKRHLLLVGLKKLFPNLPYVFSIPYPWNLPNNSMIGTMGDFNRSTHS